MKHISPSLLHPMDNLCSTGGITHLPGECPNIPIYVTRMMHVVRFLNDFPRFKKMLKHVIRLIDSSEKHKQIMTLITHLSQPSISAEEKDQTVQQIYYFWPQSLDSTRKNYDIIELITQNYDYLSSQHNDFLWVVEFCNISLQCLDENLMKYKALDEILDNQLMFNQTKFVDDIKCLQQNLSCILDLCIKICSNVSGSTSLRSQDDLNHIIEIFALRSRIATKVLPALKGAEKYNNKIKHTPLATKMATLESEIVQAVWACIVYPNIPKETSAEAFFFKYHAPLLTHFIDHTTANKKSRTKNAQYTSQQEAYYPIAWVKKLRYVILGKTRNTAACFAFCLLFYTQFSIPDIRQHYWNHKNQKIQDLFEKYLSSQELSSLTPLLKVWTSTHFDKYKDFLDEGNQSEIPQITLTQLSKHVEKLPTEEKILILQNAALDAVKTKKNFGYLEFLFSGNSELDSSGFKKILLYCIEHACISFSYIAI